jgi:hypothetical protein
MSPTLRRLVSRAAGLLVLVIFSVLSCWIVLQRSPAKANFGVEFRRCAFSDDLQALTRILESHPLVIDSSRQLRQGDQYFVGVAILNNLENDHANARDQFLELDGLGFDALHIAAFHDNQSIAALLLRKGCRLDARAAGEFTPLHIAAIRGSTNVIKLLVESGAKVDARATYDFTPLHLAAVAGRLEAATALLQAGADLQAKDKGGLSALNLASPWLRSRLLEYSSTLHHATEPGLSAPFFQATNIASPVKPLEPSTPCASQ